MLPARWKPWQAGGVLPEPHGAGGGWEVALIGHHPSRRQPEDPFGLPEITLD